MVVTIEDTQVYITLGKEAIQAISTKQPINTKSSAETELVAASDGSTPAINVLNIVFSQGNTSICTNDRTR